MWAYVGSRTTAARHARGEGISVYTCDAASGALSLVQVHGELVNPSFLAPNRRASRLYAVHGDEHHISAFRVGPDGRIQHLNTQDTGGRNPVHLALDASERFMVVSNHQSSHLAVLPLDDDGALLPPVQQVPLTGKPGPHRHEQPFAKPHHNPFDASGRMVLVPDKGLDKVFSFRFEHGRLLPAAVPEMRAREGAGPRHIVFHPSRDWAYVVGELDSTVSACTFNPSTGALRAFQVLSTLSDSFTGNSRAAEIAVHPAGHTVYVSNRGEHSIAAMSVDPLSGRLAHMQTAPSGGQTPRFFAIDPAGRWMYVLNEDSDSIVQRPIDVATGRLGTVANTLPCGSPVCMVLAGGN
ncbi:MAG: lactonase family protein [Pseudomonadota bacterium]|nr:lactonase family protein [Pseudomonadota bacterium]